MQSPEPGGRRTSRRTRESRLARLFAADVPCRSPVTHMRCARSWWDDAAVDRGELAANPRGSRLQVDTAGSAVEGLAHAHETPPGIIFMDIVMPGMDGFRGVRELARDPARGDSDRVRLAQSQRVDQLWARMQGAKDLIGKPFTGRADPRRHCATPDPAHVAPGSRPARACYIRRVVDPDQQSTSAAQSPRLGAFGVRVGGVRLLLPQGESLE